MTDKNNGDELIEITPDEKPFNEDEDMKIASDNMSWAELLERAGEDAGEAAMDSEDQEPVGEKADSCELTETKAVESTEGSVSTDVKEDPAVPEDPEVLEDTEDSENTAASEDIEAAEHDGKTDDSCPEEISDEDFSREFAEIEEDEEDNALVMEIGESLSKQIQADIVSDEKERERAQRREKRAGIFARIPWWAYVSCAVAAAIIGFVIWIAASADGQRFLLKLGSRYVAGEMNYQEIKEVEPADVADEKDYIGDKSVTAADDVVIPIFDWEKGEEEADEGTDIISSGPKEVYNILIAGEENIAGLSERGRTDLLMIASVNVTDKRFMLTSVLRDSLVAIPGNNNNKINAAYAYGGMSLLYDTFEVNLGITFDNYVLVNFEDFEKLIDMAGGVSVELSQDEAEYLRKTNYITEKANRKAIVPGENLMNGDQALGYCRIRMVDSLSGENGDSGRSERQRRVMTGLFASISDMGSLELISFLNRCLPFISTDLTADDIEKYVTIMSEIGLKNEPETLRIPLAGSCSEATLRGMLVVQMDIDVNSRALRYFIYGDGN